jgi:RNA polymerase sigma factor (sigma-70 family)
MTSIQTPAPGEPRPESLLSQTSEFLAHPAGDGQAARELHQRYGGMLEAFLRERLPVSARKLLDTVDLSQEVWTKALAELDGFRGESAGSFWWFLRRIAGNHLTDVYRRAGVREREEPMPGESGLAPAAPGQTPSVEMIQKEAVEAFDQSLEIVGEKERNAVLLRLELDQSWEAIALDCGFVSADAARMAVNRALRRISEEMSQHAPGE